MNALQIIATLEAQGIAVESLANDSRKVQMGDVFLAYPGELNDGRAHVLVAIKQGAVAIVYEMAGAHLPELPLPMVAVAGLRAEAAELAAEVYGHASKKLWLAGVTGTNGKTSVTQWLAESFKQLGRPCAIVGTLGNGFPGALQVSPNTTPDALILQKQFAGFVAQGAVACAMEVSSIGIEEGRINATRFDTAVFTNFTRDHLDYHGSMQSYADAKAKLFAWPGLASAVINLDDRYGLKLVKELNGRLRVIGYSLNIVRIPVDELVLDELLLITQLKVGASEVEFQLNGMTVRAPVVGRFNVSNLLAVIGALRAADIPLADAIAVCAHLQPPPGRMQILGGEGQPLVVVDYAHTPDALEKALTTLREISSSRGGKLHCLFGCGGDRDSGKRPLMGAIAERCADHVVLTSDNPRSEDPMHILEEIRDGMQHLADIEIDRARAIHQLVRAADSSDVILLAGKGHEEYQETQDVRRPFSDLKEAQQALQERPC